MGFLLGVLEALFDFLVGIFVDRHQRSRRGERQPPLSQDIGKAWALEMKALLVALATVGVFAMLWFCEQPQWLSVAAALAVAALGGYHCYRSQAELGDDV